MNKRGNPPQTAVLNLYETIIKFILMNFKLREFLLGTVGATATPFNSDSCQI